MKKTATAILLVAGMSLLTGCTTVQPQKVSVEKKDSKNTVSDLVNMPFPGGKMFKSGKIKLSDEQKAKFATEVRPIMHEKYQAKIQEIFILKKQIERDIKKDKLVSDKKLEEKLEKIGSLSAQATFYKLEALTKIKTILTPEQWQVWVGN